MTAPTIHRTRTRLRSRADQLADRIEAGEVLVVSVADLGAGWYVLGVDRDAGKVMVRQNGVEKVVPLADVVE